MNIWRFHRFYQLAAGACDTATGLLLIFFPAFTLRRMGIREIPEALVFVSFIGAFVFAVGISYLAFSRLPRSARGVAIAETAWLITGLERGCVGLFVAWACVRHSLEWAWITVSVVDLTLATFQIWACRAGWLRHD